MKAPTAYSETVKLFIDACKVNLQMKAYIDLGYHTGLRPQELCDLQWSDVDLEAGTIHVRCGKGGQSRTVGIAKTYGWVELWRAQGGNGLVFKTRNGKPWDTYHVQRAFQRLSDKTGEKLTPHSLRHGCAVAVAEAADIDSPTPLATMNQVRRQLGHAWLRTTEVYLEGLRDTGTPVSAMAF
jgi:integrase